MNILTRKQAKEHGLKRFYSGIPCPQGHDVERLVSTRECVECKQTRERRVDYRKTYMKDRYETNKDVLIGKQLNYAQQNLERIAEYQKRWRMDNAAHIKSYMKANAGLYAYHAALRRKAVKRATVRWCEHGDIRLMYIKAAVMSKESSIPHEVDHIVPLKGKLVSGLHCLANLQIITKSDNNAKKNNFEIV